MRFIATIEEIIGWGQPPASNYILTEDGGIYIGGATSSSSPQENTLNSAAHVASAPDGSFVPETLIYATRQEIDTPADKLLREDAELYRRLAL